MVSLVGFAVDSSRVMENSGIQNPIYPIVFCPVLSCHLRDEFIVHLNVVTVLPNIKHERSNGKSELSGVKVQDRSLMKVKKIRGWIS